MRSSRCFRFPVLFLAAFLVAQLVLAGPQPEGDRTVTIEVSASDGAFDTEVITVPAGARVILSFINADGVPHNLSVYDSPAAKQVLYYGEIINGSDEVRYEFVAPGRPGRYFFRCDLHPKTMIGELVVTR